MNHEIKTPYEGKFNSYSGLVIDMVNPTVDMILPIDIAQSLGKICRFNGQISHFYSVAQHSVLVSALAPEYLKRPALIHDAPEAYLQDIISPLKHLLGATYKDMEAKMARVIFERFNVPFELLKEVKEYDMMAYEMEKRAFKDGHIVEWAVNWKGVVGTNYDINVWPPAYAVSSYWAEFQRLFRKEAIQ